MNITLGDILTEREIKQAIALYKKVLPHKLNAALVAKIIEPNMERINRDLGQDNSPAYLAYAVEYCLMKRGIERLPGLLHAVEDDGFLGTPPKGYKPNQTAGRTGQVTNGGKRTDPPKRQPARHKK